MYYLPYTMFLGFYAEAQETDDVDMYIAERGWQDWMDRYDTDTVVKTLTTIHDLSRRSFPELRKETGLSQAKMAAAYGLKTRTLENWESGDRKPPEHDKIMLSYMIFLEIMNREADYGSSEDQD